MVKSAKVTTTVYILEEIKEYAEKNGYNLSALVNDLLFDHFFSLEEKLKKVEEERDKLLKKISLINVRKQNLLNSLSPEEMERFKNYPRLIDDGFRAESILRRHNKNFDKRISLIEFKLILNTIQKGEIKNG